MQDKLRGSPERAAARYWIESLGLTEDEERLVLRSLEMADRVVRERAIESSRPDAPAVARLAREPQVIREPPPSDASSREPYAKHRPPGIVPPAAAALSEENEARAGRRGAPDPRRLDRTADERPPRPRRPDRAT